MCRHDLAQPAELRVAQLVRALPRMQVSWVLVPPEATDFSLKNDCFGRVALCPLPCLSVMLGCLTLSCDYSCMYIISELNEPT